MSLGLTQHLTGNEGRQKKEKKTTKRVAAATAAAKEKELPKSAPVDGRDDEHSPDVGGGEGLFKNWKMNEPSNIITGKRVLEIPRLLFSMFVSCLRACHAKKPNRRFVFEKTI